MASMVSFCFADNGPVSLAHLRDLVVPDRDSPGEYLPPE